MEFSGERYVPTLRGQISYEHLHRYAIAARIGAGKRALDVASGEGYGAALMARTAETVVGIDIDDHAIEHARSHYYAMNLRFVQGSGTELPVADDSFDVVVSFETIEHIAEHDRMLDELCRVLAPGGTLVISSPNKLVYSDQHRYNNPFHIKELYFAEFRDLLTRRFRNVAIYGQRLAASSFVHPLAGHTCDAPGWFSGSPESVTNGLSALSDPAYFIAVCSNEAAAADISSGYLDASDDLLRDLFGELSEMRMQLRPFATTSDAPAALPSSNGSGEAARELPPVPAEAQPAPDPLQNPEYLALRDASDSAIGELRAALEAAQGQAEQRASEVEDLRTSIEALASLHAERDARATELESSRADMEARLGEQLDLMGALRRELDGAQLQLRRAQESALAAVTELAEERGRVAAIAQELIDVRAGQVVGERRLAADLDGERRRYRGETTALQDEIRVLREALEGADRDSKALREVLASHSWKLTAPLRRAIKVVRR